MLYSPGREVLSLRAIPFAKLASVFVRSRLETANDRHLLVTPEYAASDFSLGIMLTPDGNALANTPPHPHSKQGGKGDCE